MAEPQVVLVAWFALVASTSLSLIASIVLVLVPGHGPAQRVVSLVHHCWRALHQRVPIDANLYWPR